MSETCIMRYWGYGASTNGTALYNIRDEYLQKANSDCEYFQWLAPDIANDLQIPW